MAETVQSASFVESVPSYFQANRAEISRLLPMHYARVLEIGCGTGTFRQHTPLANEYWGIEPNQAVADIASKDLDHVLVGPFLDVLPRIPDGYFDLVIANDVIEHMPDHDVFLDAIIPKMTARAFLVGSVPNIRHFNTLSPLLFDKDWEYTGDGVLDRTHLRFFTQHSLHNALLRHGYQVQQLIGINRLSTEDAFFGTGAGRILRYLFYRLGGKDLRFKQFGFRAMLSPVKKPAVGSPATGD